MRRFLLVIPLITLLASCSSGVSSGFFVFIDGQWVGLLRAETKGSFLEPTPFSGNVTMNIHQDETTNTLSGLAIIADPETNCWTGGSIDPAQSFVTGSKVHIVINDNNGATIVIDGDATATKITALYTSTGGGGSTSVQTTNGESPVSTCTDHSGTFNASKTG